MEEPIEYDVDREKIVSDLGEWNNDLILMRTGVSHIDGDLKMKIEEARQIINEVREEIKENHLD